MIIWGFRSRNNVMGQMQYPCPQCRQNSFHTIVRSTRWFTLFFVPIFPIRKSSLSRCNICGFQTKIDNDAADAQFLRPGPVPHQLQPPPSQQQSPYAQPSPYPPQYHQHPPYPPRS